MFTRFNSLTDGQRNRLQRDPYLEPVEILSGRGLMAKAGRKSAAHYLVVDTDGSVFEVDQYYSNQEGFERRRIVHKAVEQLRMKFQNFFGDDADPELASALTLEMDAVLCGRPLQMWPMGHDDRPVKQPEYDGRPIKAMRVKRTRVPGEHDGWAITE